MEERLGRQLAFASKAVQGRLDQALAEIGSSFHTFLVLRFVDGFPGLSQRQLARRLGIEGPTLTHHLDRLVAEGLVRRVRDVDDRRVSSTLLTAKGRAHLRKAVQVADRLDADLRCLFSESELQTLRDCLGRIAEHHGRSELDDNRTRTG